MTKNILVLGCGPAAAVTDIGLHKLGYSVTVLGLLRPYPVTEGISARVYQALGNSGLERALQTVSAPVSRSAIWNGSSRSANTERLVFRPAFDAAMLDDLRNQGVRVEQVRVQSMALGDGVLVKTIVGGKRRNWRADFVVDARGRSAGLARIDRLRGPETVSLACCWDSEPDAAFSAVASVNRGWLWLARDGGGRLFTQFTTRAKHLDLPGKTDIPALLAAQFRQLPGSGLPVTELNGASTPLARSSTAILVDKPVQDRTIRIGDAAMAVDPLSGNGIFQSLSSALVAPAVINTILKRPEDADLAKQFYRQRLQHLFYRFARIGRDFYQSEARWENSSFWRDRRCWPDQLAVHPQRDTVLGTGPRPVLNEGFIELKTVLLTADQPLGIWRVDGREVTRQQM